MRRGVADSRQDVGQRAGGLVVIGPALHLALFAAARNRGVHGDLALTRNYYRPTDEKRMIVALREKDPDALPENHAVRQGPRKPPCLTRLNAAALAN